MPVPRVPPPSHRHGAPSGPWPFLDIGDAVDQQRMDDPDSHIPMSAKPCEHAPASPSQEQQKKSRISKVLSKNGPGIKSTIHYLDVMRDGALFVDGGKRMITTHTQDPHWKGISSGLPSGVRLQSLFIDDLSGPVLQMLGTRYNLEPFFFSSSIGWIPSRFQSHIQPGQSDHITITLPFIRRIETSTVDVLTSPSSSTFFPSMSRRPTFFGEASPLTTQNLIIDTQSPLHLRSSEHYLVHDLLCLHMLRTPPTESSTIISLHAGSDQSATSAQKLKERMLLAGKSVYWNNIFQTGDGKDDTLIYLSLFWYVLYAWDECMEALYSHICALEAEVMTINDIQMTNELHLIRAHLLHYASLLTDFRKSINFILSTPHPALSNPVYFPHSDASHHHSDKERIEQTLLKECTHLIHEIDRLEMNREMQDKRLKNVMGLGFSMTNIEDSRRMQKLTEAAVRDSAAMKQIAYLTMVFVPASFVATAFGMNITALTDDVNGTLGHYMAITIPLTILTTWIIVAYQIQIRGPRKHPAPSSSSASSSSAQDPTEGKKSAETTSTDTPTDLPTHLLATPLSRLNLAHYKYHGPGFEEGKEETETITDMGMNIWARMWWPIILLSTILEKRRKRKERERGMKKGKVN